jgi:hypothetical protein
VLPVRLQPGTTYRLGINCSSAQGFRSATGHPAEPSPLWFTTASDPMATADRGNRDATERLRELLATRYSHAARTGADWEALLKADRGWLLSAPTAREWGARAAVLLAEARDPHLYLRDEADVRHSTWSQGAVYNGNMRAIERSFPDLAKPHDQVWWARRGDVGYLAIHGWDADPRIGTAAGEALDALLDTKALVLDVRANGGGDEDLALSVASRFLESSRLYARHRFRDPDQPGGWTEWRERWVHPADRDKRYAGHVIVLQGPVCLSSNEAFLLAMRQCPRVTTMGATSGGSSANPRRHDLGNGWMLVLPSWQSATPEGEVFEGIGLAPDIPLDGDTRHTDPVLARALEFAAQVP